jgi:hypothetical protein
LEWLKNTEKSDVDFWAYGTKEQRTHAGEEMFRVLLEADKETKAIELGSSVLSFHVPSYPRPLQLIFVHGKDAVDVVHRFDIDTCEAFIEKNKAGKTVLGLTPEAERAWYTRTAKFSAFKKTEGDMFRLTKLFNRGWTIGEPSWVALSDEDIKARETIRARTAKAMEEIRGRVGIERIARMSAFEDKPTGKPGDFLNGGSS